MLSPPGAVTGLQWYSEPSQVVLKWDLPDSDGGQPITGYDIFLNVDGTGFVQEWDGVNPSSLQFTKSYTQGLKYRRIYAENGILPHGVETITDEITVGDLPGSVGDVGLLKKPIRLIELDGTNIRWPFYDHGLRYRVSESGAWSTAN